MDGRRETGENWKSKVGEEKEEERREEVVDGERRRAEETVGVGREENREECR